MTDTQKGGCFCGTVGIEVTGDPAVMGYCHCSDCRSYAGAPIAAFTLWNPDQVAITRGEDSLGGFNKTGFSHRRFCTKCGGHVLVQHPTIDLVDIHASTLPSLDFVPTVHLNYAETVLPMRDGLPKMKDFPAEVGGSGGTLPE